MIRYTKGSSLLQQLSRPVFAAALKMSQNGIYLFTSFELMLVQVNKFTSRLQTFSLFVFCHLSRTSTTRILIYTKSIWTSRQCDNRQCRSYGSPLVSGAVYKIIWLPPVKSIWRLPLKVIWRLPLKKITP